jgi:hypothetical protein
MEENFATFLADLHADLVGNGIELKSLLENNSVPAEWIKPCRIILEYLFMAGATINDGAENPPTPIQRGMMINEIGKALGVSGEEICRKLRAAEATP